MIPVTDSAESVGGSLQPNTHTSSVSLYVHRHHTYKFSVALRPQTPYVQVQCCFTSTDTIRTSSVLLYVHRHHTYKFSVALRPQTPYVQVQCCFTSTDTIRTIRDEEPGTATSTLTQRLSSDLYDLWLNMTSKSKNVQLAKFISCIFELSGLSQ